MLNVRSLVTLVVAAVGGLLLVAPPAGAASPPGQLSVGEELHSYQSLTSPNGQFSLVVERDGRLRIDGPAGMIWYGPYSGGANGGILVMQADGNLVDYQEYTGEARWSTRTGAPGAVAVMQDDGNLVVYAPGGRAVWASKSDQAPALEQNQDRLLNGQLMGRGDSLVSQNGSHRAVLQTDGNVVVYGPSGPVWATGTGLTSYLFMQRDGNLVLYESSWVMQALWHTRTGDRSGTFLVLDDDGILTVHRPDGSALWSSRTSPGEKIVRNVLTAGKRLKYFETLVSPNFLFRAIMQSDGNVVVYGPTGPNWASHTGNAYSNLVMSSGGDVVNVAFPYDTPLWHSGTAGNPGAVLVLQDDGNLVVYAPGGRALWASLSPWSWNSVPIPRYAPRDGWYVFGS